jgi:branched-chain amino acid transport system permease protein
VNQVLLFLLLGLGTGATIAAIAVGIVVTYRGSGFINLAAGAIAMLAGFSFWALRTGELGFTLSTPPAVVLSYVFVIAISIVIELAVFRPLRSAAPLAKLVASLGVLLTAQASMLLAFGTSQHPQPTIIPVRIVRMLDSAVPLSVFVVSGIVVALTAILWALYRWTRFGLATRAASENDVGARLAGLSPNELSLANTLLANLLLGTLGILAGSVAALDTTTLPFLVVPALAAALFARLTSFWIACLCGLGIGMMESLIEYASTKSWFPTTKGLALPGVKELLVFALIVAAMFLRGASLPTRGELVEQRLPDVPRPKHSVKLAIPATALCAIALVVLPFDFRQALTNSLIGIVMALSLVVITGFVGQISVVQLALAGVAGFTVSHLAVDAGIGFPLAPLVGVAAAVLLGLVTAVSALRVRGVGLAVVTIAAAVAVYNFGFINPTWGGGAIGSPVPDPHLFGINLGPNASFRGLDGNVPSPVFGWVALTAAVLLGLLVVSVRRGILGRRMLAVRSNERAAAGAAINVRNVKLTAFGISALIAGVAGTLYAYNFGSVSADRFSVPLALSLIAFAYTGGITLVSGAVFAGLVAAQGLLPYTLDTWFGLSGNWFLLFGGLILIFTLIQNPDGVAGSFYRTSQARAKRKAERSEPGPAEAT